LLFLLGEVAHDLAALLAADLALLVGLGELLLVVFAAAAGAAERLLELERELLDVGLRRRLGGRRGGGRARRELRPGLRRRRPGERDRGPAALARDGRDPGQPGDVPRC